MAADPGTYVLHVHEKGASISTDLDSGVSWDEFAEAMKRIPGLTILSINRVYTSFGPIETNDVIETSQGTLYYDAILEDIGDGYMLASANIELIRAIARQLEIAGIKQWIAPDPPNEIQVNSPDQLTPSEEDTGTTSEAVIEEETVEATTVEAKKEKVTGGDIGCLLVFALLSLILLNVTMSFWGEKNPDLTKADAYEGSVLRRSSRMEGAFRFRNRWYYIELSGVPKRFRFVHHGEEMLEKINVGDKLKIYCSSSDKVIQVEKNGEILHVKESNRIVGVIMGSIFLFISSLGLLFMFNRIWRKW